MEFNKLINLRESCRSFDPQKEVSDEIIKNIIESARLSPSACNGQPYFFTVCKGDKAKEIAKARDRYMKEYIAQFMAEWEGIQ